MNTSNRAYFKNKLNENCSVVLTLEGNKVSIKTDMSFLKILLENAHNALLLYEEIKSDIQRNKELFLKSLDKYCYKSFDIEEK